MKWYYWLAGGIIAVAVIWWFFLKDKTTEIVGAWFGNGTSTGP